MCRETKRLGRWSIGHDIVVGLGIRGVAIANVAEEDVGVGLKASLELGVLLLERLLASEGLYSTY